MLTLALVGRVLELRCFGTPPVSALIAKMMVHVRLTTLFLEKTVGLMKKVIFKLCVAAAIPVSLHWRAMLLRKSSMQLNFAPLIGTQEGHEMDIEKADKSMNSIIEATRTQLKRHRDEGVTDEDFVLKLMNEFVKLRKEMSAEAGSIHMALSCYRLAVMADYVDELEETVDFHKSAVEFLLQLDEFESI